jgi:hypothetical protein
MKPSEKKTYEKQSSHPMEKPGESIKQSPTAYSSNSLPRHNPALELFSSVNSVGAMRKKAAILVYNELGVRVQGSGWTFDVRC